MARSSPAPSSSIFFAAGLAGRGVMRGDVFVVFSITFVIATIALFIFFPVSKVLGSATLDRDGSVSLAAFAERMTARDLWQISCLSGGRSCGVFWNSLALAITVGVATTLLGFAFALLAHRTSFRAKRLLNALAVLPVITPPFVIGLGIILLFGRSGVVTTTLAELFGVRPGRWIYGFNGLVLAQVLSFTPIAYLVMAGVVQGVSPSMEEAAQTLRASPWRTFSTVTWPLIRPGVANAFLIGFVESLADFGNPLVLGGNFDVLSTDIFFAVVGAQHDPGRAAVARHRASCDDACGLCRAAACGSGNAPTRR